MNKKMKIKVHIIETIENTISRINQRKLQFTFLIESRVILTFQC